MDKKLKIKEIINSIGDSRFEKIISDKIDLLLTKFPNCPLRLIDQDHALKESNLSGRAKIKWADNDGYPKTPLEINIDKKNLKGLKLFISILHEFGHLTDYNNPLIQTKSQRSEVSAWKNVLNDLKKYDLLGFVESEFESQMKRSLRSYEVFGIDLIKLEKIDISTIDNRKLEK